MTPRVPRELILAGHPSGDGSQRGAAVAVAPAVGAGRVIGGEDEPLSALASGEPFLLHAGGLPLALLDLGLAASFRSVIPEFTDEIPGLTHEQSQLVLELIERDFNDRQKECLHNQL